MLAKNKLRAKIIEKEYNIVELANKMGISTATFYRKEANDSFLVREVEQLIEILDLTGVEVNEIFFTSKGA